MLQNRLFTSVFMMLAMAGMSAAATMTPATPDKDGDCYQIGTAAELYGFAAIVNGTDGHTAEPTACGVLTADIVVNENVLSSHVDASTGSWTGYAPSYDWTPIGTITNMFRGAFDGQGHTISGLYFWETSSYYVGLFGYVGGGDVNVSIKNVGVVDSYFRVKGYSGGIVGMVYHNAGVLNIENVYSGLYIKGEGEVGGLVGYVKDWTLNITNAYNSGSIFGTSGTTKAIYVAGLVGCISSSATVSIKNAFNYGNLNVYAPLVNSNASVQNSYYLGDAAQGKYGVNKSASDFSNGSVFAALRSAEGGSVWHQYQGDSYPSFAEKEGKTPFVPHSATLHYSSTESETIYFVEGSTASLPIVDKSENSVLGWYDNEGLTGTKYTEIPASANSDLSLYPKVMKLVEGCFEISDADMLYAFAAAVNNGNTTACGKLTANIVVNQNVLGANNANVNVDGSYNNAQAASTFRVWTPIGNSTNKFQGAFNGQGHTISGLYFNDPSSSDVGLFSSVFGEPKPVTIENVGLVDSYFRGNSSVGGLVGNANGQVTIKNSFNAGSINAQGGIFGGLVGYSWRSSADVAKLTISNSYNTGSLNGGSFGGGLVGSAVDLIISNSYNTGSVTVSKTNLENGDANCVGGFAASADKVTITNSYNYGSVSSPDGARKDDFVTSFNDGSTVTNSFFISECDFEGNGATKMSSTQFSDGTVFAALRSAEDGEVWRQYSGDVYPTFVEKTGTDAPSPMHVAVLHYSETDSVVIAYTAGTAFTLPTTLPDGSIVVGDWYKFDDLSGDAYTKIAATENGDLNFYAKAMKLGSDGYYEISDADELYAFASAVNNDSTFATAKAKLMNDIVVNQNVLGTDNANVDADGNYIGADSASFREWTPIGNNSKPFKGSFDGQGYTISGLYCNGTSRTAGLFGYVDGTSGQKQAEVSIQNIGVEDSYFKAEIVDGKATYAGGILAYVGENGNAYLENVYSSAVAVAPCAGGVVGYFYGYDLNMTNVFNTGSIFATTHGSGLVGAIYSSNQAVINNSYNYGTFKEGDGALIGFRNGGPTLSVTNSYYQASEKVGDYGTNKSAADFENGTVLAALRAGKDGYVWVQAEGDKYPAIDINASKNANTIVLDWSTAADSTTLVDAGYTNGAMVIVKDGKQFYANGAIYEGILSAAQVAAIGSKKLYPISGVELETVNGKLVATLNGDSQDAVMIPTDVRVNKVVYNRDVATASYKTVMLPFSVPVSAASGFTFYKFRKVDYNDYYKRDVVYVKKVAGQLEANTPYIMIASSSSSQIVFEAEGGFTLNTAGTYETSYDAGSIVWKMKGVYESKVWEKGDEELGFVYGFADQNQDGYKIGDFTKLGDGASIVPMRVYMVAEEKPKAGRPGLTGTAPLAREQDLPEGMAIVIDDSDAEESEEKTLVLNRIKVAPTAVKSDRWFDLRGRALNGKPTTKGTYYHNGQRVIIK